LTALDNDGVLGYTVLAIVVLVTAYPFVTWHRERAGAYAPPLTFRALVDGLWVRSPDFGWAFGGRLLGDLGNALGTTYLVYFLQDDLKLADPDTGLLLLSAVYLVFTLTATVWGGRASDRSGRRRRYVAVAALLQAVASFLLTAFPAYGVAIVA